MPRKRRSAGSARPRRGRGHARAAPDANAEPQATARGIWSGTLSFGLVTVPIELVAATRRSRLALRMLAPDGMPLVRRYACSAEGRSLADDEVVRGFETARGDFVLVTDEELEQLAPRRSRDIELVRIVPRDAIDPAYFVRSYFVLPGAENTKAYRLLAQTLEAGRRAAVATFVMHGRSTAIAIFADRGILRAETLRFGDEVRSPREIRVAESGEPRRVAKLRRAIEKLEEPRLEDRELAGDEDAELLALARKKLAEGRDVLHVPEGATDEAPTEEGEAPARGAEVIDLFDLVRKRLHTARAAKRAGAKPTKKRTRAGGRRR